MAEDLQTLARKAGELIRSARHAVAFTGAGISTPSGIPDFRSAGSGLWTKDDPMVVASLTTFRLRPDVFFNWLRPLARSMAQASPNPAHLALARMEAAGLIQGVITQNIDDLHRRAGTRQLYELHGTMDTLTCPGCRQKYASAEFKAAFIDAGEIPHCPRCGKVVKPDIVLFEEMLPMQVWRAAEEQAEAADLMLVVGSALEVGPANTLPALAVQNGASLIINTRSETFLDEYATLRLPFDVAETLPLIADAALAKQG